MTRPALLTETPRAGIYGHRFILPRGSKMTPAKVENFLRRAAANSIGKDYLAGKHLVKQQLPNGTIRTGNETIVLANVNVGRLSPLRKDNILKHLNEKLADLDELIGRIDWPVEGKNTSVQRDELNEWLAAKELQDLPAANLIEITPLHAILAGILLGLLAGLFIIHLL